MRKRVDATRLGEFMRAIGRAADRNVRIYFTGGTTAVLHGWRESTIDVDIKMVPESDRVFRELPRLKETLEINIELASPDDFIPPVPGWEDRSELVTREGRAEFLHYDYRSQALSKIERGHEQDLRDVREMIDRGLVTREDLISSFEQIEPLLYRYPAVDARSFRSSLERFCSST